MYSTIGSHLSLVADCLIVIVTGLPGAGKSTLLSTLQLDPQEVVTGVDYSAVRVAQIVRLDDFLLKAEGAEYVDVNVSDTTASPPLSSSTPHFTPSRWKVASTALLDATERAIRAVLASKKGSAQIHDGSAPLPVVFVEDNMHYESMRRRYWHLCQRLSCDDCDCGSRGGDEGSVEAAAVVASCENSCTEEEKLPFVALVELRFTTPLATCLARNDSRLIEGSAGARMHIPRHVVESMFELFDHCYSEDAPEVTTAGCWRVRATTQPWPLITFTQGEEEAMRESASYGGSPMEQRTSFFNLLTTPVMSVLLCEEEKIMRGRWHTRKLGTTTADPRTFQSAAHRLDLHLRVCVERFFKEHLLHSSQQGLVALRGKVKSAKSACLAAFKNRQKHCTMVEDVDSLVETLIMEFQETLLLIQG